MFITNTMSVGLGWNPCQAKFCLPGRPDQRVVCFRGPATRDHDRDGSSSPVTARLIVHRAPEGKAYGTVTELGPDQTLELAAYPDAEIAVRCFLP